MGFDLSNLADGTVYALLSDGRSEVLKKIKDLETYEVNENSVKVKLSNEAYETLMGRLRAARDDSSNNVRIRKVIFSGPATIVFWNDGSKTVVKCTTGDHMNYEMGIAMCTLKKLFGDSYLNFKKDMKKWVPEETKQDMDKCWNIKINSVDSERIDKGPRKFAEAFAEFLRDWDKKNDNHT